MDNNPQGGNQTKDKPKGNTKLIAKVIGVVFIVIAGMTILLIAGLTNLDVLKHIQWYVVILTVTGSGYMLMM